MRDVVRRTLSTAMRSIVAFIACVPFVHAADAPKPFLVFDSLFYAGKPDLAALGMLPARGTGGLWRNGQPRDEVDTIGVQRAVACCRDFEGVYFLDVEHWPISGQPEEVIEANIAKFIQMAGVVRNAQPDLKFGYYAVMPDSVYWPIVSPMGNQLDEWRASNRRTQAIANHVDVIFPSLYTHYMDPDGWELFARETLKEAKRYGKPVYAFLWPEFHDNNKLLGGRNVPPEFWRRQLEFCREHADGIVIWGGWQKRWDENAGWWRETKLFMQTLRESGSTARPMQSLKR